MSSMKTYPDQRGELNVLLIPLVLLILLCIGAGTFAFWAFGERQDYKNNSDQKVATAVAVNTKTVQASDAKDFAEKAKNPLTVYMGPDAYGSVKVSYPKTWSVYVDTTNSSTPLDAYFHQAYVPAIDSKETYNLRVQVNAQSYNSILQQYSGQVTAGDVKVAPYSLPKVPAVSGSILAGKVLLNDPNGQGTLILLPMRDKTLMVWTESPSYLADFNTYILPNLTFSP